MSTKDTDPAPAQGALLPAATEPLAAADLTAPAADAPALPGAGSETEISDAALSAEADAAVTDTAASETVSAAAAVSSAETAGANAADAADAAALIEAAPDAPAPLPGELLEARRKEMRLSIEELSARVKLAPRQLLALEANDFGSLPGMATTRGFIRSYAKAMGMDPEPLLAMVTQEPNPALSPMVMRRPLPQQGFNGRRYAPSTSHRRSTNKLSGLGAVVLIFVGVLAFIAWRNDWLTLPDFDFSAAREVVGLTSTPAASPDAPEAAATDNEPAAAQAVAPAAVVAPSAAPVSKNAPASKNASATEAGLYAPADPVPAMAKADTGKAAVAAAPAAVDPARALELRLREDSWVEVLAQNGERKLVSRLMKAGSTERIEVSEPVVLIVGNASGVEVTLRGQPVSLKSGTRDNVAKLNLK